LCGTRPDLSIWQKLFHDRKEALVQNESAGGETRAFLRSATFDDLQDVTISAASNEFMGILNGAAKAWGASNSVARKWIWYIRENGSPEPMKLVTADAAMPLSFSATVDTRALSSPPPPVNALKTVALEKSDAHVAAALRYFEKDNWFDFWKTFETIRADLKTSTGDGEKAIQRWVGKADLSTFKINVEYHRHFTVAKPTPTRSLSEIEARAFLAGIVRQWLLEKGA
jgi:hypothetical protein